MLKIGFVKIDRKITQWRWYHDANTFRVFFHLIVTANYEDKDFETITIKRGERVISYPKLASELKLTEKNIRTAIKHLKKTEEVAVRTYPKFSVITINNYNQYQADGSQQAVNGQTTGSQAADNGQSSGNNERKINKDKESKKDKEDMQSDKSDSTFLPEPPKKKKSKVPKNPEAYEKIIYHLNSKANTLYRPSGTLNQKYIDARLNEGFTVENFITVIDKKCAEWLGTDMEKYLRPETLFGNKFESYLNQVIQPRKQTGQNGIEIEHSSVNGEWDSIFEEL